MTKGRKVPPRPTLYLPDLALRTQIAAAVHQAICDLMRTDGSDRCAYYAAVTANIMPHLTGATYTINSGTLQVCTSPDGMGFEFDAQSPLIEDAEFHALLVRDHGDGRFECADLASRHWRTGATRLGAPWNAPEPPTFIWGMWDDFESAWPLGVRFHADEALTNRHIAWLHGPGAAQIRQLSGAALRLLGAQEKGTHNV